eukprot:TRINITY_DN32091_c0_g1_i1.p1 TRINITY_DN32091_c0_g1~~TRINITY_DN32091_c0_g1_i1.p1  ORF type:complete len:207 (-),score=56.84 TRINITY_DN32091_c0_g1_i1:152-772(-)
MMTPPTDELYKEAIKDMTEVVAIEPTNEPVRKELEKLRANFKKSKHQQKATFKKFMEEENKEPAINRAKTETSATSELPEIPEIGQINQMLLENMAAVKYFEEHGQSVPAEKYKSNVEKLDKMKNHLLELRSFDLEKPVEDLKKTFPANTSREAIKEEVIKWHRKKIDETRAQVRELLKLSNPQKKKKSKKGEKAGKRSKRGKRNI